MRRKLRVVDVEQACACPFYMQDNNGQSHCLVKMTTTPQIITSLLESDDHSDFDYWDMDCGGEWGNCSILPLLYRFKEDEPEVDAVEDNSTRNEKAIAEYNPFGDSEDPDDYPDEPESPIIMPAPDTILQKVIELEEYPTRVSIHQVPNPYLVKSDVLVLPTNNQLYIDDLELRKMLRGTIENELETYRKRKINMGKIYVTTNGGEKSYVKSNQIYHAVVAGTSRLVNEGDVSNSTFEALVKASLSGAKKIVLIPGDCGTLDIYATAMVQIGAIKQFLSSHAETSLEDIFIVMTDEPTYQVYQKYYRRIFKKRKSGTKPATATA